jgi:hypothetical protein
MPNSDMAAGSLLDAGVIVLGLIVGVLVWSVRPEAFKWLKVYFITVLTVAILATIGMLVTGDDGGSGGTTVVMRYVFHVAVWWPYFKRSKRVRATFGSNFEFMPKCICTNLRRDCQIGESMSFKCPVHGLMTIDRRIQQPVVLPHVEPPG